jgi:3-hydroxyisobutyrate dehydrogenase-like beta-hydroxyacid dehydrogenase
MQVVLAYKNFAANRAVSHIGLGVTALNAAKSMRAAGIQADVWPIATGQPARPVEKGGIRE